MGLSGDLAGKGLPARGFESRLGFTADTAPVNMAAGLGPRLGHPQGRLFIRPQCHPFANPPKARVPASITVTPT